MKKCFLLAPALLGAFFVFAQGDSKTISFYDVKAVQTTPVKNQAVTGTCWCFSATSMLESEELRKAKKEVDLSEMFTVRNLYIEKAKNYVLRQGSTQFGEGALGHHMIEMVDKYGAVPEAAYTGLVNGATSYNHIELSRKLKLYLDGVIKHTPVQAGWMEGYVKILDQYMGAAPENFAYEGKTYTPKTFAAEVLKFSADDYVSISSFTHVPYYKPFVLQVPDNFSSGQFYNLPLNEMVALAKESIDKGYSVTWDADVSNKGFQQGQGFALNVDGATLAVGQTVGPDMTEQPGTAERRQQLFENLSTQDDHLMHLIGVQKTKDGRSFFLVKNSWGKVGPFEGFINVSEAYFAINTVSIVVPKAALSKEVKAKLKLQ